MPRGQKDNEVVQEAGAQQARRSTPAKIILPAVAVAVVVLCAAFVALQFSLPQQASKLDGLSYDYVCSGAKSSSVDFALNNAQEDSVLLFDSSQLLTSADTIPQVPKNVLGGNSYGFDLNYIGEPYTLGLWHAMAAAAYAPKMQNKKVAIITGVSAYTDGGLDNETFGLRFSYSLYRAFCDNPNVSDETKAHVARRLAEQGVEDAKINAGLRTLPQDYFNDAVFSTMDDIKLRQELQQLRGTGDDLSGRSDEAPPFESLYDAAFADADAMSTNNDWGMDDAFYAGNIEGRLDELEGSSKGETYTDTPEYEDFELFLKVCEETGLDPLVIISPVHGAFYDWVGIDEQTRIACYDRIRAICNKHGVAVADFSDREYELNFLHDIMHFGWTGWLEVEEAIANHVADK